ncbi:MAG: GNAT family N-acetyltransferase [Verrucomicrobia bacterium]|nr:GNAT family N-acetyltransferase [Verrucomicrobiota bacterium]
MVLIRKICPHDTPQVKQLIRDILDNEFASEHQAYGGPDLDDPARYYGGQKDVFLVAEKDGVIIGTVAIKEDAPDTALLRRIFLNKAFRGKGYGAKLLQKALTFCFEQQYQNVTFRGTDTMQAALQLCLKEGFKETDVAEMNAFKMHVLTKRLQHPAIKT